MLALIDSFLPLVTLIGLGFLCRRRGLLGDQAARELTRFVVWLALPAMLFDATAGASLQQLWQPAFVAAFSIGIVATFLLTLLWRPTSASFIDRCLDSLGATYANTGFLGIPLAALLLGKSALLPATIATLITACLLFALVVMLVEMGMSAPASPAVTLLKATRGLLLNPLVLASALGVAWSASGLVMPGPPLRVLQLLADAATPCALVSMGAMLAERAPQGRAGPITGIVVAKLVLQPLICGLLVYPLFKLPAPWAETAVLLSALPTGSGPFMLAELYGGNTGRASRIVLVTTVLSLVTLSACIVVMR